MFFFFSKILSFLVMPLTIIVGLFLAAALIKRVALRKRIFIVAFGLMLFFSNEFIANEVMMLWEIPVTPIKDMKKDYDLGIVLTGVTNYNIGPNDRVYFGCGADRVTHTVQLYKMGKIKKILVSGGSGRLDAPEAKEAYEVVSAFKLMGVLEDDIFIESESRNTHESAEAVKKMLEGKTEASECLLITSGYHLRRSIACFKKVDLNMDSFSVDFRSHKRKYSFDVLFVPKIEALSIWNILVREWVGITAYKVAGYI
jgi:uncharacterized SAM-binding protein YcdF (DUF218 family)